MTYRLAGPKGFKVNCEISDRRQISDPTTPSGNSVEDEEVEGE